MYKVFYFFQPRGTFRLAPRGGKRSFYYLCTMFNSSFVSREVREVKEVREKLRDISLSLLESNTQ